MYWKFARVLISMATLATAASVALADDLVPPPWDRGLPATTTQEWTFDDVNDIFGHPIGPFGNPYGDPRVENPGDAFWFPDDTSFNPGTTSPRTGVIGIGPDISLIFLIPNQENDANHKDIWVQLTWWADPGHDVVVSPLAADPNVGTLIGTIDLGNGWHHTTASFVLEHQPPYEQFIIQNLTDEFIYADQLVIDTRCVPEPATMAILGLGIAGLVARRKKN